ncbi:RICIN domain-containing protein [Streptomyces sp. NPDC001717]|uniref:RICIN domain-containing protein n=1 Tax=Streptomyces sp. NPDC001717 TaxID=3364604 RepID=UPI003686700A
MISKVTLMFPAGMVLATVRGSFVRFGVVGSALRAGAAVISAVVMALCLPASYASATVVDGWDYLQADHSFQCLEIADWRTDNGAPVRQWPCITGNGNQLFLFSDSQPGTLKIYHSGKCLEIADWRTDNGAPARQWGCTGGNNQKWLVHWKDGGSRLVFENYHSGKCLEIADWSRDVGAPARQWTCSNGENQKWLGRH